tara:strand:- start:528 stop:1166 length:639 start_codon:yes stop_codon:yes gene_type:complete
MYLKTLVSFILSWAEMSLKGATLGELVLLVDMIDRAARYPAEVQRAAGVEALIAHACTLREDFIARALGRVEALDPDDHVFDELLGRAKALCGESARPEDDCLALWGEHLVATANCCSWLPPEATAAVQEVHEYVRRRPTLFLPVIPVMLDRLVNEPTGKDVLPPLVYDTMHLFLSFLEDEKPWGDDDEPWGEEPEDEVLRAMIESAQVGHA